MVVKSPKKQEVPDALASLGTIIGDHERRDAIHLAVSPAVAAHTLRPGEHVGFLPDGEVGLCNNPVGIVDPFLKLFVKKGERFWLVVYPRQITSLRHVWTHPAFADEQADASPVNPPLSPLAARSKEWLENYALSIEASYDELMEHAKSYLEYDDYWVEGSRFEGEYVPDEFWSHYETVTGTVVSKDDRGSFFSCSC